MLPAQLGLLSDLLSPQKGDKRFVQALVVPEQHLQDLHDLVPAVEHVLGLDFLHYLLPPEAIELHALEQLSVDVLPNDFDVVEGE